MLVRQNAGHLPPPLIADIRARAAFSTGKHSTPVETRSIVHPWHTDAPTSAKPPTTQCACPRPSPVKASPHSLAAGGQISLALDSGGDVVVRLESSLARSASVLTFPVER